MFQYVPRILRVYLSTEDLQRTSDSFTRRVWMKGALNFFLYVMAGHVFGGFWYFFSIYRETACWHEACVNDTHGCIPGSFNCYDELSTNLTLINKWCPVDPTNETVFDFGIYVEAIEYRTLGKTDFLKKFSNCFSWGLRNLSSFGSNLKTSSNKGENWFVVMLSTLSLLLVSYLIGNLQLYMQPPTKKSDDVDLTRMEELQENSQLSDQEKDLQVMLWINNHGIPKEMSTKIMQYVKLQKQEGEDFDVRILLSAIPSTLGILVKKELCLRTLKKVPELENLDEQMYDMICRYLNPVVYEENTYIIREGEPLDFMLFITQGVGWTFSTSSSSSAPMKRLQRGNYYGIELLKWVLKVTSSSEFPVSICNIKSKSKVEAFTLSSIDMETPELYHCLSSIPLHVEEARNGTSTAAVAR